MKRRVVFHLLIHSPEGVIGLVQPYWLKITNFPYPPVI